MNRTCFVISVYVVLLGSLVTPCSSVLAEDTKPQKHLSQQQQKKQPSLPEDTEQQPETRPRFSHFRFMGGLFYLWRSTKAMQPSSSQWNARPSSTRRGNPIQAWGALGSVAYFFSPHIGVNLGGGIGRGWMSDLEFEWSLLPLGEQLFDVGLLGGVTLFSGHNTPDTLGRLTLGGRGSFNISPTMGVSGAIRFAPFYSTLGSSGGIDLFSLGDLLQIDIGVFFRL